MHERVNAWMSAWVKPWSTEWISEEYMSSARDQPKKRWVNQSMDQWAGQWLNECKNEWTNDWMNQRLSRWSSERGNEGLNQSIRPTTQWTNEQLNERMDEWTFEPVRSIEWMKWKNECSNDRLHAFISGAQQEKSPNPDTGATSAPDCGCHVFAKPSSGYSLEGFVSSPIFQKWSDGLYLLVF